MKKAVGDIKGSAWPADHVERRSVESLIPYARNARTHSEEQVAQLAASIKEWGWTTPVLVDEDGQIIAGHGRVMAARKLGIEEVPVMIARGWTEAQRRAYVLADNQLAANAGWDMDLLKVEINDLDLTGFDLDLIGFDDKTLAGLLQETTEGLTDEDAVPDVPAEPVTVLGDVWALGRHRLMCGDSTQADVVSKLLGDVRPHLMVTDPPYGVEYDPTWRDEVGAFGKTKMRGKVENDDRVDWREAWALFTGDVAYVWCAPGPLQCKVFESLLAADFDARQQIVWAKQHFAMGRGHYHYQHEVCWYAVKSGRTGHWSGDRKQTSLWHIANLNPSGRKKADNIADGKLTHGTQKPVECMKRPIENNSSPGQAVYEPFSGSGTTIIAGEMTGRHVYAIELNPAYVDVAVKRWQDFTGQEAVHAETGKTFNELSNGRSIQA